MDGNSAKKVPLLDRLIDSSAKASGGPQPQPAASSLNQNKSETPKLASSNESDSVEIPPEVEAAQPVETPKNRRTDKSQFEIELTQIVNRLMSKHISAASEEIVKEVLLEVRARLPGQRKN